MANCVPLESGLDLSLRIWSSSRLLIQEHTLYRRVAACGANADDVVSSTGQPARQRWQREDDDQGDQENFVSDISFC